jgi:uncharacterized repeat protein (TIGR01451 family)
MSMCKHVKYPARRWLGGAIPLAVLACAMVLLPGRVRVPSRAEAEIALPGDVPALHTVAPGDVFGPAMRNVVSAGAVGEAAPDEGPLDILLVIDRSGSKGEETRCYGCYEQGTDQPYPAGVRRPLPYDATICEPQAPITHAGHTILVAEAEYFSASTSYAEHDYHYAAYTGLYTYWTLQRTADSQASGYRFEADDRRGAHLMHHPHGDTWPVHNSVSDTTPRVDYDFIVSEAGTWYVWMRAQCGAYTDGCKVHWGLDGEVQGTNDSTDSGHGGYASGSYGNRWVWIRLGQVALAGAPAAHQINFWGGGPGFRLDKILLTTNPEGQSALTDNAPAFIQQTTPDWAEVQDQAYQTYIANSRYGGPPDTGGRTGWACHKCNPIYGLQVNLGCQVGDPAGPGESCEDLNGNGQVDADEICDHSMDDLFDDLQPMRLIQGRAQALLQRLNARRDQLGLVTYSSSAKVLRDLNCVAQRGTPPAEYGPGDWDPETGAPDPAWTWCYDHRSGDGGYEGDPDTSVAAGSIVDAIETLAPSGSTNVAHGLQEATKALSTLGSHYGRPCAAPAIILISDGQANQYPDDVCWQEDLWDPPSSLDAYDKARDCLIYYARQAGQAGVVLHAIGVGAQVNEPLLRTAVAETGGTYHYAPYGQSLDAVWDEILAALRAQAPALEMEQGIAAPAVRAGQPLTYTLHLTQTGRYSAGSPTVQTTVVLTLPAQVAPNGVLTWPVIAWAPLPGAPISGAASAGAASAVWTQTVPLTVDPGLDGPLTSTVAVLTRNPEGQVMDCMSGQRALVLRPALEVTKRAAPLRAGDEVLTYTLAVTNSGDIDLRAAVTDVLPAHVGVAPSQELAWTPEIAAGETWTQTVAVSVERGYAGPLVNVAQVTTREGAAGSATATVTVPCCAPSAIEVAGPGGGCTGEAFLLTATVSPPAATLPLTYTWQAAEGATTPGATVVHAGRGISDTVAWSWEVPGAKAITVTARNRCGAVVTATHSIAVERPRRLLYLPLVVGRTS